MMSKLKKLLSVSIIGMAVMASGGNAHAQQTFPAFNFNNVDPTIAYDLGDVQFNLDKNLMRDVLMLQEQNNLLNAFIARQSEIQKLAGHYKELGAPYRQPPPPQSVCEKLPENILCVMFYPDLDKNKSTVASLKQGVEARMAANIQQSLAAYDVGEMGSSSGQSSYTPMGTKDKYAWSDITCVNGTCSALVRMNHDDTWRHRVTVGDNLAEDIKVSSITPNELIVIEKGKKIELGPLAVDASAMDSSDSQPSIADIVEANLAEGNISAPPAPQPVWQAQPQAAAPQQQAPTPAPASQSSNDAPMLGETGLF